MQVLCPGCGKTRDLGSEVAAGDMVSCAFCAGVLFRLAQQDGQYVLLEVPQASCPRCETIVRLPDTVQAGETFQHCGQTLVVTHAYGAYALEQRDGG
jgi:phage FluMu protein Com